MPTAPIPRVALLVETARGYGRQLLRGIVRYARLHGPWSFYVTPGDFEQALPKMQQWGGTGIIARVSNPKVGEAILKTGLPAIALDLTDEQLRPGHPLARLSEVSSGSQEAAEMAADHLLERKFRHYAFVGITGRVWSQRRQTGFCQRIEAAGFAARVYPLRKLRRRSWEHEQTAMAEWLRALPKPVGLMACNDDRGREVLEACRAAELKVPEEIAVVGIDNDELLCELADPPLSSVALNAERGGYEMAALLDEMMRGQVCEPRRLVVQPLHVVARRSTDILALEDQDMAGAMQFIHHHSGRPIQIDDVAEHLHVSRRTLEIRFRKAIGRTVHAEIQLTRLDRARRLLLETDLPIPKVAEVAGYGSSSYLIQVFRQEMKTTPARFRLEMRTGRG
jgi:LacI family transcriptional regulator